MGESTHLIDQARLLVPGVALDKPTRTFVLEDGGDLSLPIWVDHVGSDGTRYVRGRLVEMRSAPSVQSMPKIDSV